MTAAVPGPAPKPAQTAPSRPQPATTTPGRRAVAPTGGRTLDSQLPARNPSTPKLISGLLTLCVALVVLFTTVAVGSLAGARSELSGAVSSMNELTRVYEIRTELLRADALAVHGFMTAAADPNADAAEAVGRARGQLVHAAEAEPHDRDALAEVNRRLDAYVAALEHARVERDTPAGVTALAVAGDQLRAEVLPELTALTSANSERVITQTGRFPGYWLVTTGVLAAAALLALAIAAAIRFRRVVNLGVLAALALVAASFAVSGMTLLQTNQAVADTARHSVPLLGATAEARTHGFDAHAREALAVIARDTSPAAQEPWDTAAAETTQSLERPVLRGQEPELHTLWMAYEEAHEEVRQHALAGRWDEARSAAADSSALFAEFDTAAADVMTGTAATVEHELSQQRPRLLGGAVVSAVTGLAAIACTVAGLRARLREYR